MSDFDNIILELKDFAHSLNINYIDSFAQESGAAHQYLFAKNIVQSLSKHKHLFPLLSKMHQQNLDDCLRTHGDRYIRNGTEVKKTESEIADFKEKIVHILDSLKEETQEHSFENHELNLIRERLYKILKNAQVIFAEQSHNTRAKESLQALAIAYSCYNLHYDEQNILYDKLLQIKELWVIETIESADTQGIKYKFHQDPPSRIKLQETDDANSAFEKIIILLTGELSSLETLTDEQLAHLYDRNKNLEWAHPVAPLLLNQIHDEARFRYSYNRLSDSGYDLLNRFQSFDALIHQIDNLEFSIMESFLINNTNFINDILLILTKHADNIRGLALSKDKNLGAIFKRIDAKIHHLAGSKQAACKSAFTSLRGKLGNSLDATLQKRYMELYNFQKTTLQNRYSELFERLDLIIEEKDGYIDYIQELFVKKLTSDFHLPNLSNSIDKLRKMADDRSEAYTLLSQLHLANIFLKEGVLNKIKSLDFKYVSHDYDIKSAADYINKLISEIVSKCSAFQLDILYKPLLNNEMHTEFQIHLKERIAHQIHQRMSVGKMLFSIMRGKKKEYDKLKNIKKTIKQKMSVSD